MKKFILTIAIAFIAAISSFAQEYTWDKYNFKFTIPEEMELLQNDDDGFIVKNNDMVVGITPFEYEKAKKKDFKKIFGMMAQQAELDLSGEVVDNQISSTNCETFYMVAQRLNNPNQVGIIAVSLSTVDKVAVASTIILLSDSGEEAGKILGSYAFGE